MALETTAAGGALIKLFGGPVLAGRHVAGLHVHVIPIHHGGIYSFLF